MGLCFYAKTTSCLENGGMNKLLGYSVLSSKVGRLGSNCGWMNGSDKWDLWFGWGMSCDVEEVGGKDGELGEQYIDCDGGSDKSKKISWEIRKDKLNQNLKEKCKIRYDLIYTINFHKIH